MVLTEMDSRRSAAVINSPEIWSTVTVVGREWEGNGMAPGKMVSCKVRHLVKLFTLGIIYDNLVG